MRQAATGQTGLVGRLFPGYGENRALLGYVGGVVACGLLLLGVNAIHPSHLLSWTLLFWLLANLAAELLWLETGSGEATDSMAMTVNLASIMFLGEAAVWVIGVSVFLATRVIQKRDWFRCFFALGQMVLTAFLAGSLFRLIHPAPMTLEVMRNEPSLYLAMLLCGAAYFLVNTWLVAGAVTLERDAPFWTTWHRNFAFRNSVLSSIGLFSLSPLVILSFLSVGHAGLFMFFLPLTLIKNQNRDYVNLQKMTQAMIENERMAAQGEMAAQVSHEMNNILAVLSARSQMISMWSERLGEERIASAAQVIRQQITRLASMAKGLMDFGRPGELQFERFDLNRAVLDMIDFIKPQNTYDDVELVPELQPDVGQVEADSRKLTEVMINLIKNAADAIHEQEERDPGDPPVIRIRTVKTRGEIQVEVHDNGPGMPPAVKAKVFDLYFTTKKSGHGFGLATCFQTMKAHSGTIRVDSEVGKGTVFTLSLPRKGEAVSEAGGPVDAGGSAGVKESAA